MLFLTRNFDILPIEEALARVDRGNNKQDKPFAVVTFDDGYKGNLSCMLPIIEDFQIPVTVYISSQAVESGQVYWYDRVISLLALKMRLDLDLSEFGLGKFKLNSSKGEKANWGLMQHLLSALKKLSPVARVDAVQKILLGAGEIPAVLQMMNTHEVGLLSRSPYVTIGGHSHCHNILTQLSDNELATSIKINRSKLQEWTGQEIKHFSYPNGNYDSRVVDAVKRAGYVSAVTTHGGLWNMQCDAFMLPRKGIGRFDSLGLFIARMAHIG